MKTDGAQALLFDADPVEPSPKRERRRRSAERKPDPTQLGWRWTPLPIALPRDPDECKSLGYRWPHGKCQVWHCAANLVLEVRRKGRTEAIVVGARGGLGVGYSVPSTRTPDGKVEDLHIDALWTAAEDREDDMISTCLWDYTEDNEIMPRRTSYKWRRDIEENVHMTLEQIGDVMGITREGVRRTLLRALAKLRAAGVNLDPAFVPASRLTRE